MNKQNNQEWNWAYADTSKGIEHWKGITDLLKHAMTVSSALSVFILAVYEKLQFGGPKFILIASISFFIIAAACSLIAHVIYVASFQRGLSSKLERQVAGSALALVAFSFCLAFILLLIYFLLGVVLT